ncbi:PPOX class F420-dependent oxidoreductase [Dactylosporangium roseum]|uniref:PPOX class F420-dependent oxidoreductase n=1 Tax=Dactylosporangium roseum TaxID=47989 RepID=A0ABY5Z8H1_9ACTN|nr:PPOX class F420-dependent oxidoreductase [Dactylosporangium roseum]UWZ37008.1 PPOX class F420-dependent oxidoreductase [Dactylosporangium roseum]
MNDTLRELLDRRAFLVLSTINPDGAPQSSVIWAKHDGGDLVFSTIRGRRKTRNMERDPRVSLCVYDPANPYRYVEVRGTVSLTEEGGPELIQELSRAYGGQPFTEPVPGVTRVVCRVSATKIIEH